MSYKCKKCQSGNIDIDSTYTYHDIYTCRECSHIGYFKIEECSRRPSQIVTIHHYSFDLRQLYFQCTNCLGANKNKPLKSKDYSEQIRAEFNQWGFDEWKSDRKKEANEIHEGIKQSNYLKSERYRYRQYLLSPKWKEKRRLVMQRDASTYLHRLPLAIPSQEPILCKSVTGYHFILS